MLSVHHGSQLLIFLGYFLSTPCLIDFWLFQILRICCCKVVHPFTSLLTNLAQDSFLGGGESRVWTILYPFTLSGYFNDSIESLLRHIVLIHKVSSSSLTLLMTYIFIVLLSIVYALLVWLRGSQSGIIHSDCMLGQLGIVWVEHVPLITKDSLLLDRVMDSHRSPLIFGLVVQWRQFLVLLCFTNSDKRVLASKLIPFVCDGYLI